MKTRTSHLPSRMLISSIVFGLLVLGIIGSAPDRAVAQMGQGGSEQVQAYIERTEELLIWAQGLVSETQSVPARKVLQQASELHRRSQGMYGNGKMSEALAVSRRSRAAMWHSVRMAREAMGLQERIRIRSERFSDQHSQLMERAMEAGDRQAVDFLRRSERSAVQAREQYHQGDFNLSWKKMEQAGDLMRRAARVLADGTSPERLELEMERTAGLIERTRESFGEDTDPQARKLLAEAEEALVRAREGMNEGRPGQALQMTGLARKMAIRAGALGGAGPDEEAIRRQMERFDERSALVADKVRDSGSKQAQEMYQKAIQHRTRTTQSLAEGNGEMAMRQIRAAHDMLGQAEDLIR